jgi:hypothetical protein
MLFLAIGRKTQDRLARHSRVVQQSFERRQASGNGFVVAGAIAAPDLI